MASVYESPEFQLDWDNQVKFHLSRHLQHLRRYRRQSQAAVAKAIGSSQPQIARIEGGDENVTADTVERITRHLNGRFRVSIAPAEFPAAAPTVWWDSIEDQMALTLLASGQAGWYTLTVGFELTQTPQSVIIGVTSPSAQTFYSQTSKDAKD